MRVRGELVRRRLDAVAAFLRRVAGMPDYERFVAHRLAVHPGCPVPSREAYFAEFVRGRYERPGTRCC